MNRATAEKIHAHARRLLACGPTVCADDISTAMDPRGKLAQEWDGYVAGVLAGLAIAGVLLRHKGKYQDTYTLPKAQRGEHRR